MNFLRRLEFSFRLGLWAGSHGWVPTRKRCPEGDRIYSRRGYEACTNELTTRWLDQHGGSVKLRIGGHITRAGAR